MVYLDQRPAVPHVCLDNMSGVTCIVVSQKPNSVRYLLSEGGEITVKTDDAKTFDRSWKPIAYGIKSAIRHYCNSELPRSELARDLLAQLEQHPAREPEDAQEVPTVAPTKSAAVTTDDELSLAQLCETLRLEPRIARAELRKQKIEKPSSGRWSWPKKSQDLVAVTKVLTSIK